MTPLYAATATGGRSGRVLSADGVLDLPLTMPKGLGGSGEPGANPEQLFAAGYAACFGSALGMIARMQKLNPGNFTISANVTIGKDDSGFGLAVELVGHMPDLDRTQAEALMAAAHQVCPYSRATRGNIPVSLRVAG